MRSKMDEHLFKLVEAVVPIKSQSDEQKRFVDEMRMLDFLTRIGESSDEIEFEVLRIVDAASRLFGKYMERKGLVGLPDSGKALLTDLFSYVYLWREDRGRTITKMNEQTISDFLKEVIRPEGEEHLDFAYAISLLCSASFGMLAELGFIKHPKPKFRAVRRFLAGLETNKVHTRPELAHFH